MLADPRPAPDLFVLTPEADPFAASWPAEFARLRDGLAAADLTAAPLGVGETVPAGVSALALLAWGYHLDPDLWLSRLGRWEATGVLLLNPIAALRWNTSKTYLAELHDAGLPVVPTMAVPRFDNRDLAAARRRFGTDTLVAKPQIGACAHGAILLPPGISAARDRPAILQPFVPSIRTDGELSLVFLGGCFSHAVCKRPAAGDFRVQSEHGGSVAAIEPPLEALLVAQAILAVAPIGLVYARVDLVRNVDGHYRAIELELIEPQLFLDHAPLGVALLAAALRRSLRHRSPISSRRRNRLSQQREWVL